MMISVHRQKVISGLNVDMPSEMYKYCYKIVNNEDLVWGIFKDTRNKKRTEERNKSWKELSCFIKANFILPTDCRIWLSTRHLRNGVCSFSFYVKDKEVERLNQELMDAKQ